MGGRRAHRGAGMRAGRERSQRKHQCRDDAVAAIREADEVCTKNLELVPL
jgi:hypothetical protein